MTGAASSPRSFDAALADAGIRVLKSPPQAPRANAFCERMIGTLRRELFERTLILGESHLRLVLTELLAHYNTVRPHRALGQLSPSQAETAGPKPIDLAACRLRRKPILGGPDQRVSDRSLTERRHLSNQYASKSLIPSPTRLAVGPGMPLTGVDDNFGTRNVSLGRWHVG